MLQKIAESVMAFEPSRVKAKGKTPTPFDAECLPRRHHVFQDHISDMG